MQTVSDQLLKEGAEDSRLRVCLSEYLKEKAVLEESTKRFAARSDDLGLAFKEVRQRFDWCFTNVVCLGHRIELRCNDEFLVEPCYTISC